jgi:hypothetical protein
MSKPALIFFFTTRVHTTKSTVKILAANRLKVLLQVYTVVVCPITTYATPVWWPWVKFETSRFELKELHRLDFTGARE